MGKRLRAMRVHRPEPEVPAEPVQAAVPPPVEAPAVKAKPKKGGLLRRRR